MYFRIIRKQHMTNAKIKHPRFAKKPTKLSKSLEDFMRFWAYPDKPNHTYPKCVYKFLISFDDYLHGKSQQGPSVTSGYITDG